MAESLEQQVRRLASDRCEYCRVPESVARLKYVLDHIVARQHGGKADLQNLALCCGRCNQHKGPNLAGIDPQSGSLVPLFNPRADQWSAHFRYDGAVLTGLTPSGRATVVVLAINLPIRVTARQALLQTGLRL